MVNERNVQIDLPGSADQTRTTYAENKLFMDLARSNAKQTSIVVLGDEPIKA
jgi:hypothetical protein